MFIVNLTTFVYPMRCIIIVVALPDPFPKMTPGIDLVYYRPISNCSLVHYSPNSAYCVSWISEMFVCLVFKECSARAFCPWPIQPQSLHMTTNPDVSV